MRGVARSFTLLVVLMALFPSLMAQSANSADRAKQKQTDDLTKACKSAAQFTPASAYCRLFAVYLTASAKDEDTSEMPIYALNQSAGSLAAAYSIRRVQALPGVIANADKSLLMSPANLLKRQIATPASVNGSTTLVAKTAETNLLAVAVESGALTQSQSGNSVTIQANLDHLFEEAFTGSPGIGYLPQGVPVLENITASATLGLNANSSLTVPTSGSATSSPVDTTTALVNSSSTKLTSFTANYEFNNPLTPKRIARYRGAAFVVASDPTLSSTLSAAENAFVRAFIPDDAEGCGRQEYQKLKADYLAATQGKGGTDEQHLASFVATFNACFEKLATSAEAKNPNVDTIFQAYTAALVADTADFQSKLKKELTNWDLSAQYVYNRPAGQPETHDFRVIGSGNISNAVGSVWTVNAAMSLYGNVPDGAQYGRLKDAQFSGELDRALGSRASAPSFALAGYGQYQSKPSVLNITATSVPSGVALPANAQVFLAGTQGWLGVVQAKITLHMGSAQIPLAAKWSNKTDLLDTKNKLGAQFGLSYDLSQLKQVLGSNQ